MARFTTRRVRSSSEPWRLLSQTAEYAIRSALYIARRERAVPAADVAEALAVPTRYLGHVLNELVRAEVLTSMRGPRGGFRLRRPAAEIPLADVVAPFDGVSRPAQCLLRPQPCGLGPPCFAHDQWRDAADGVRRFFHSTTLGQLIGGDGDAGELRHG
jgi:Rrf2 family protein